MQDGLRRSGLTLRQLCRTAAIDPSFFSKVLAGKRSPPAEEDVLRRVAAALKLDAAELIVSAGRIPAEWAGLLTDAELFRRVHMVATGASGRAVEPLRRAVSRAPAAPPLSRSPLAEELL